MIFKNYFKPLILSIVMISAPIFGANAQDEGSVANVVFANAISIFMESKSLDEEGQKQAAQEILRMFDLIVTAYPTSLPSQRIKAGGKVGPIDLEALRVLAGVDPVQDDATNDAVDLVATVDPEEDQDTQLEAGALDWHQRVVRNSQPVGGHIHGDFPSIGQRTHAGTDVLAACDEPVTAVWDGTLETVVKAGDAAFPITGNAVVIRHGTRWNPPVYSAYFFLADAPNASNPEIKKGDVIGRTGRLHGQPACGVHFEVRTFGTEKGPFFELWNGVLGVGNWSEDTDFASAWRDPQTWLAQLETIEKGKGSAPTLLAKSGHVSIYLPGALSLFNRFKIIDANVPYLDQGLRITGSIRLQRADVGFEITPTDIAATRNSVATQNVVGQNEELTLTLVANAYSFERPNQPIATARTLDALKFNGNRVTSSGRNARVSLPAPDLNSADFVRVSYETNDGRTFKIGEDIVFEPVEVAAANTPEFKSYARQMAVALAGCTTWVQDTGATITLPFKSETGGAIIARSTDFVSFENLSKFRVQAVTRDFIDEVSKCDGFRVIGTSSKALDWTDLEFVLGRVEE